MLFIIIPRNLMTKSLKKWLFSENVLFSWTFYYRNSHKLLLNILIWLCNSFILVPCILHDTHFIYLFPILQKQPRETLYKVIHLNNQTWNLIEIYLSSVFIIDMSHEVSIKENIDGLIYGAIETKIPKRFFICNCFSVNTDKDKDFIEYRSDTY